MKVRTMLIFILTALLLAANAAYATEHLLCVSSQELKGEQTVASCVAKGERFAVVDAYGIVHILTPEEVELTRAFNPKALEMRAFGMQYAKLAPGVAPMVLPRFGETPYNSELERDYKKK